jgi:hypothetical protein
MGHVIAILDAVAYTLRAVLGREDLLRGAWDEGPVVALSQGLALIPLEEKDADKPVGLFYGLTEQLQRRLIAASAAGPVAYVEAEFFEGTGTQSGIVWRDHATLVGQLHTQNRDGEGQDGFITVADLAINQILRVLGVATMDGRRRIRHDRTRTAPSHV